MLNLFATVTVRPDDGSWSGNVMRASSVNRRRILSLWLPRLPTDRVKRLLSPDGALDDTRPCVGGGKLHNALQITALNDAAARIGLESGLPLANARAICPEVQVFDADDVADTKLLENI